MKIGQIFYKNKGLKTVLYSLRYRNYRLFFAGQRISLVGPWMQMVAISWLVYHLTNSALLLGSVGFAPIRSILLLLGLVSLVGMPYLVLMPIFAKDILHGGAHTLGFLMAAAGIGALVGGIYLASRKSVLGLVKILTFATGIFGLGLIVFAFSKNLYFSLSMMLVSGFGMLLQ